MRKLKIEKEPGYSEAIYITVIDSSYALRHKNYNSYYKTFYVKNVKVKDAKVVLFLSCLLLTFPDKSFMKTGVCDGVDMIVIDQLADDIDEYTYERLKCAD